MKKLLNYLPTHFTVCLIVGIVLQFHYTLWCISFAQSIVALSFLFSLIFALKLYHKKLFFTITSWFLFVFIGMFMVFLQNDSNKQGVYVLIVYAYVSTHRALCDRLQENGSSLFLSAAFPMFVPSLSW